MSAALRAIVAGVRHQRSDHSSRRRPGGRCDSVDRARHVSSRPWSRRSRRMRGCPFVPSHFLPPDPWVDYQDIDGVLLASFGRSKRDGWSYELFPKRVCDSGGIAHSVSGWLATLRGFGSCSSNSTRQGRFCLRRTGSDRTERLSGCLSFAPCGWRRTLRLLTVRSPTTRGSREWGGFLRRTSLDEFLNW